MDLKSGLPWWLIKNSLFKNYKTLENNLETEIVIVGSGITGALAAHFLCEAGIRCIIVDKRLPATGSTSASTAQLQYEIDTPLQDLIEMRGVQDAVDSYRLCLQSIYTLSEIINRLKINCDFEMKSSLYLAENKKSVKKLEKEYQLRKQHGLPVEYLNEETLAKRFNIHRPAALYNNSSAQVDAYTLTKKLLEHHIQHSGLQVYSHTEISKTEYESESILLTTSKGFKIRAKKMICAPGFESEFFLKDEVMKLNSTYVFASRPLKTPLWPEKSLIWESAKPYFYIRTTKDSRIIVGGEDEKFQDPKRRDRLMEKKNMTILKKFKKLFPHIDLEIDFYWCGTFGETKDGLPYIGQHPDHPHSYFALGYGGNGITFSVIAAEIIRDLYLGKPSGHEKLFAFGR